MSGLLWIMTSLVRWIRLKIYQYEVTFAVYMLTPTEKFIFSTLQPLPQTPESHLKSKLISWPQQTLSSLRFSP